MAVKALPAVPASFPSSVEDPVAVMAIAAAPKAKEEPHRYAAPPVPATEQELIAAIQRELVRLGYYNGPITTRWNGGVRAAARKFTGARRPIPAQGLLMALRAVKPEAKPNATGQRSVLNLQSAQDLLNGRAPAAAGSPTLEQGGVLSDGYLPPWEAMAGKERQAAQSASGPEARHARATARTSRRRTRRARRSMFADNFDF
jgi:peptidoglycan hydrolase-like protein with peptidoglycan-binding domain